MLGVGLVVDGSNAVCILKLIPVFYCLFPFLFRKDNDERLKTADLRQQPDFPAADFEVHSSFKLHLSKFDLVTQQLHEKS